MSTLDFVFSGEITLEDDWVLSDDWISNVSGFDSVIYLKNGILTERTFSLGDLFKLIFSLLFVKVRFTFLLIF